MHERVAKTISTNKLHERVAWKSCMKHSLNKKFQTKNNKKKNVVKEKWKKFEKKTDIEKVQTIHLEMKKNTWKGRGRGEMGGIWWEWDIFLAWTGKKLLMVEKINFGS